MKRRVGDLEFTVTRSARRTADIVVERDGQVVVRAPSDVSDDAIDRAVRDNAAWVHRTIAEWEDLNAARRRRPFVQGSSFPYLGRHYRIRLVAAPDQPLMLRHGWFELDERVLEREGEAGARKAFRDFYASRGQPFLEQRVALFARRIDVSPGPVAVRELGYHWASCGRAGAINVHWKVMMAPSTVVDYIVAHELCHLKHRDHSMAFWNEVDKVVPNYRERKDWLRVRGASLDL
jgi:predicted metal-dependent hydrolase